MVTALTQTATLFGGLPVEDSETECEPASDEGSRAINIGRTLRVDPIVHQILFYVRGAGVCRQRHWDLCLCLLEHLYGFPAQFGIRVLPSTAGR